ncbi:thioredoxin family protein [Humibacter albus]|uniref:thioredoxin family protein n=1 Tax=Humibacter albus TaxID=427754 RepID=UPI0003B2E1D5|nr:thioredoxin family protein [Humibacter albus]
MNTVLALIVTVGLVVVTTAVGAIWRARTGRVRSAHREILSPARLGANVAFGANATIVQFSTEFCGPCRTAQRLLRASAAERDGVRYVEVDLTGSPRLATEFAVMQTPTILLLDAEGGVRSRIGGVPRPHELNERLDEIVKESHVGIR